MRIGTARQTDTFIAGICGVTVAGGVGVIIDCSVTSARLLRQHDLRKNQTHG